MTIGRAAALALVVAVTCVAVGYALEPLATGQTAPDDCQVGKARNVLFHASGERLGAVLVGAGTTGVVLANESTNHDCQWWPLPRQLALRGYRVLAFNYGSGDKSTEVQAAARYLRSHGAKRLVLIGASIGGAMVIDAAIHLHSPPVAVVSLSAVPEATGSPFPRDARLLPGPILQIGSAKDPHTRHGADTVELYRASPSLAKRLLLVPGTTHGVHLVDAGAGNRIRDAIVAFIRAHTPYDVPPPPIPPTSDGAASHDARYAGVAPDVLPTAERLKDVLIRMLPYWYDTIVPDLFARRLVIVSAHGNSLAALVKHLDGTRTVRSPSSTCRPASRSSTSSTLECGPWSESIRGSA